MSQFRHGEAFGRAIPGRGNTRLQRAPGRVEESDRIAVGGGGFRASQSFAFGVFESPGGDAVRIGTPTTQVADDETGCDEESANRDQSPEQGAGCPGGQNGKPGSEGEARGSEIDRWFFRLALPGIARSRRG